MMNNVIEIYFQDLTDEKQAEILEMFGDNCNWDVIPIVSIPVNVDIDDFEDQVIESNFYDDLEDDDFDDI